MEDDAVNIDLRVTEGLIPGYIIPGTDEYLYSFWNAWSMFDVG